MFHLAYHLHWGYDEMLEMPFDDMMMFFALLADQKSKEKEE